MKTKQKAIVLLMCAALLVAASVFGTFAYLTDNDSVTNTFTVGQVHLTLDEAKTDTEGKGIPVTSGERTTDGNNYRLLPGQTYTKDPTVTVDAGSEDAYVRMMVTIEYKDEADGVFAKYGIANFLNFNSVWDTTGVIPVTTKKDGITSRTYEFRYVTNNGIVPKSGTETKLPALFTTLTVPDDVTNDEIAKLAGMKITVVAHAIQADGFDDADAAWTAFESSK